MKKHRPNNRCFSRFDAASEPAERQAKNLDNYRLSTVFVIDLFGVIVRLNSMDV